MKKITQQLRDKLLKDGYLKNIYGLDKDIMISSITKNGRSKRYWICEDVLFNYYYENNVDCDDKDYMKYCAKRKQQERRFKNK